MQTNRNDATARLGELLQGIRVAMLTSVGPDGELHSRPMATLDLDFEGELWFFTDARSHKVGEVEDTHAVNLAYVCHDDHRFISVSGTADLVRDRERAENYWRPTFKAWFPEGLDDPNLALLRVRVDKAQYWDAPNGKLVHLVGFVKALATGERYRPGDTGVLDLHGGTH